MKFIAVFILLGTFLSAEVLKIAFSRSSNAPYVEIEKRQLTGGVLKELVDLIAKQSGVDVEYVLVSKRNQEALIMSGDIDGTCLLNPQETDNAKAFIWSEPLYTEEDVLIVRRENAKDLKNLNSLKGHKLGVLKYNASLKLKPYFETHSIERINNKKLFNNINQLRYGVIDAVIDTKVSVGYCVAKKNVQHSLVITNTKIDEHALHCMFRKELKSSLQKLNSALSELKKEGSLDKIVNRYKTLI